MIGLRTGSLCSGYGGLTMAVNAFYGATTAWNVEYEAAPSRILAHHYPDVPNLGDITAVDWAAVEPVDILEGGTPCQDVSHAGKRAGMRADTRSGLWASMCDAIDIIRPQIVVWENVRGVLSAEADSQLEPCPGCVGDGDDGPVLRAFGRVLGDLAGLGFDARWCGLRAADVGAPHGRYRVFVVATANTEDERHERRWDAWGRWTGLEDGSRTATDALRGGRDGRAHDPIRGPLRRAATAGGGEGTGHGGAATDASRDGWDEGRTEPAGLVGGPDAALSGSGAAADADDSAMRRMLHDGGPARSSHRPEPHERRSEQPADAVLVLPPETALAGGPGQADGGSEESSGDCGCALWGQYAPAVHRWEICLGRTAPPPTELSPRGARRLSPLAVEWMQGLPVGHVTNPGIGISRNDQLKALGNGVVPQQAFEALRRIEAAAAAEGVAA